MTDTMVLKLMANIQQTVFYQHLAEEPCATYGSITLQPIQSFWSNLILKLPLSALKYFSNHNGPLFIANARLVSSLLLIGFIYTHTDIKDAFW